ncbi:hypothetical protein BKI52_37025 [marine bacterium AO1-C]|nr:hypothetical protein BKI52_37025 [marine bacterium AO1-C]
MLPQQYKPTLRDIVNTDFIPSSLNFIKEALDHVLEEFYYHNFRKHTSFDGTATNYSLDVHYYKELQLFEIPGLDWAVSLNPPDPQSASDGAKFEMSLFFRWRLLQYIQYPDIPSFDFSIKSFLLLLMEILDLDYDNLIKLAAENFHPSQTQSPLELFVTHYNNSYSANITYYEEVKDIVNQVRFERDIIDVIVDTYLHSLDDLSTLVKTIFGGDSGQDIKDILIPELAFSINDINLGMKLPRKVFKPVDQDGNPIPEPAKSALIFHAGSLHFSSQKGLIFEKSNRFDFQKSEILNTGIVIEINQLKLDLSEKTNIPEADLDNRSDIFRGFYAETATVTLPPKWFKDVNNDTAQIAGRNLLVGTGGLSGTIALEAVGNSADPTLIANIGSANGFQVGFKSFDLTFQQNVVTASSIAGQLVIPRLKNNQGQPAQIEVTGHLDAEGDFLLTASEVNGFTWKEVFGVMDITVNSAELGREDDKYFLGISGKIEFTNDLMKKILKEQAIEVSKMRIYSDGSFEIVGGTIPVPTSFNLNLGPLEIGISGINFGSYQREHLGVMRRYYVFGFDGALGIGPIGVEARGKGMQYFFTVDNDAANGKPAHDYFTIQTVEVDITIPGNATPDNATAIIQGYLSIPQPGESLEYEGGVSVKLPKARISGSAEMRLSPQYPAFLINAQIGLPKPIPLGATGLGIYGFSGLLGYRYVAEKTAIDGFTGDETWYEYMAHPEKGINTDKFSKPEETKDYNFPFSVGAGATLATMDDGFILSTRLFLLLSLPSVFILEGKANILSKRLDLDSSNEPPFFAFLAIGDNSIEMGLGADYKLPKSNGNIIDLYAEVQAGFFFNNPSAWYLNFGTKEKPISARLLSLLEVQAFLMLSAKGIEVGARAEFNFDKRFGPAHVKAWLYAEVGAKLSFEQPQLGGYVAVGGGLEVSLWFISLGISFDAILAAEAAKPFLVYAQFRVCGKIRIGFIKIRKCVNVELKWEKNKQVDRTPIAPLSPARAEDSVKGVNMLTGETFDLINLGDTVPTDDTAITGGFIPLDTYVDIKFTKAVLPNAVADKIGGINNPPENYTDLIPPEKTVKGGKELRQVKHQYSIEAIALKIWDGENWVDYHPYEAITNHANTTVNFSDLKIGHWQKSDGKYDAIRLLASTPFSYTEQGEPGWFVPEQLGITAATLFCEGVKRDSGIIHWLSKPLDTRYIANSNNYYYHQRIYFKLTGTAFSDMQGQTWGTDGHIANDPDTPAFAQSLQFDNSNDLELKFPEDANEIALNLSTEAQGVTIQYYQSVQDDNQVEVQYSLVSQEYKTKAELANPVTYNNPAQGISKVVVVPAKVDQVAVNAKREAYSKLYFEAYKNLINNGGSGLDDSTFINNHNTLVTDLTNLYAKGGEVVTASDTIPANYFINQYQKGEYQYYDQIETPNGIYAVGKLGTSYGVQRKGLITKLNTQGEVIWEKSYEVSGDQDLEFRQVVACDNGDVMLLAYHGNLQSGPIAVGLFRVQSNGENRWSQVTKYDYVVSTNRNSLLVKMSNDQFLLVNSHSFHKIDGQGARGMTRDMNPVNLRIQAAAFGDGYVLLVGNTQDYYGFALKVDESLSGVDLVTWDTARGGALQIEKITYNQGNFFIAGAFNGGYPRISGDTAPPVAPPPLSIERFIAKIDATASLPQSLTAKVFSQTSIVEPTSFKLESHQVGIFIGFNEQIFKFDHQLNLLGNYAFEQPNQLTENVYLDDITSQSVLVHSGHSTHYLARLNLNLESCRSESINLPSLQDLAITFAGFAISSNNNTTLGWYDSVGVTGTNLSSTRQKLCTFPERSTLPTFSFKSHLHQVKWQSVENYEFNQNIPAQNAIQEDYQASVDAINKTVTPVWRPNAKYYIHFKLQDNVDNGGNVEGFDYYYGFQTAGPLGHFHNASGVTYGASRDSNGQLINPDKYALANLRKYIDYQRSYPNADGNLLRAKPLFYSTEPGINGSSNNEIALFFSKAYAIHMLANWPDYQGLVALESKMQIVVKDPIEDISVENPPPPNVTNTEIPQSVISWESDDAPLMPEHLKQLNNFINTPDLHCLTTGGEPIKPLSYVTKVALNHLKPQKMYTAIVNNVFEGQTIELHNFVFQTSRYANFTEQVNSYALQDEQGNQKPAIFNIDLSLDASSINSAYSIVSGNLDSDSIVLENQFNDLFTRVTEGWWKMNPLAPALTTEFNFIKDTNSGNVVALLIRNPEPFNDPKIPLNEIQGAITVMNGDSIDNNYHVLFAQDYSQALVMHNSQTIMTNTLTIQFQYKKWNGNAYQVFDTVQVDNLTIQL